MWLLTDWVEEIRWFVGFHWPPILSVRNNVDLIKARFLYVLNKMSKAITCVPKLDQMCWFYFSLIEFRYTTNYNFLTFDLMRTYRPLLKPNGSLSTENSGLWNPRSGLLRLRLLRFFCVKLEFVSYSWEHSSCKRDIWHSNMPHIICLRAYIFRWLFRWIIQNGFIIFRTPE